MEEKKPALSLKNIRKVFPGVVALDGVSIDFYPGEVHALIGENGAGKSTFIKAITGAHAPDGGTITVDGETYTAMTPALARKHGIECIYQEFNLIDVLSAAENICYGEKLGKLVNQKKMNKIAEDIFKDFGVDINPKTLVRNLTPGQMQIVEIAKAVSKKCKILILDEPTAPLSSAEVEILFRIINRLKEEGVALIFISHRLDEIFEITQRVSILRDGKYITTLETAKTNRAELIKYMVGREMTATFPPKKAKISDEVTIEVKNLTGNKVKNISFKAHKGEILGVSGLVGAGRTEIMKVLYGAEKKQWGEVYVNGKLANIKSPHDAMYKYGITLIPEDRKREGCFLGETISWNLVYNVLGKISRGGVVNKKKEREIAEYYWKAMRIKAPSMETKVMNLSGGNQQKVVVGKAMATQSEIIIFDEPTRGIDVGAKYEIYELMNEMCEKGNTVIMVTSDMEELLGMSDRIIVFGERCLAGELTKDEFDQERVLDLASTGGPEK